MEQIHQQSAVVTENEVIHALNLALVTMAARLEMHQELIEMLIKERMIYTETRMSVPEINHE